MTPLRSREQAAAAVTAAVAEHDTIQANLLELDNSFGKRLLAGATLTGETKKRWDVVAADLTTLWPDVRRLLGGGGQGRRADGPAAPFRGAGACRD